MARLFLILALSFTACASASPPMPSPKARYVEALDRDLSGDAKGYYDRLIALANDAPQSRAGRRARATLDSGGWLYLIAAAAAGATFLLPNVEKIVERDDVPDLHTELAGLAVALQLFHAENGQYCESFAECEWEPSLDSPYLFYMSVDEVIGGGGAADVSLLRLRAETALLESGISASVSSQTFVVLAVGDPDDDGELDVWAIDDEDNIANLMKD